LRILPQQLTQDYLHNLSPILKEYQCANCLSWCPNRDAAFAIPSRAPVSFINDVAGGSSFQIFDPLIVPPLRMLPEVASAYSTFADIVLPLERDGRSFDADSATTYYIMDRYILVLVASSSKSF